MIPVIKSEWDKLSDYEHFMLYLNTFKALEWVVNAAEQSRRSVREATP